MSLESVFTTDCKGEERTAEKENTKDFPLADATSEECDATGGKKAATHHSGEEDKVEGAGEVLTLHVHFSPQTLS